MTPYLPYHSWMALLLAHQWLQCGQMRPFPAPCMVALLGALARITVPGGAELGNANTPAVVLKASRQRTW